MNRFKSRESLTLAIAMAMAMAMSLAVGTAMAQHSETTYAGPDDKSRVKVPAVDKDGDGCIDKTEVTQGSQLEKRFKTRDADGDGKLCKDEYYTP